MNTDEIKSFLAGKEGQKVKFQTNDNRTAEYTYVGLSSVAGNETARTQNNNKEYGDIYLSSIVNLSAATQETGTAQKLNVSIVHQEFGGLVDRGAEQ